MMKKIEFDKEIMALIKKGIILEETKLKCTIWHDCNDTLYINTELLDKDYNALIEGIAYNTEDDVKDNKENLVMLELEQKKIFNKVRKWALRYQIEAIADEQSV